MREMGVVRKIDKFGRIVLPSEARRLLNWNIGDNVEVCLQSDNTILMRKHQNICALCGNDALDGSITIGNSKVCPECIHKITNNRKED